MSNLVFPNSALWTTREPSERATSPEWMSFHSFEDAQRCPLAASLRSSHYASIWSKKGYPNRPNVAAVSGVIVHTCAETIVKRLVEAGVSSLMDPAAMALLRQAGGFTKMLLDVLEDYRRSEQVNPRFVHFEDDLLRSVRVKIPQMRVTLQELLASHSWTPAASGSGAKRPEALESDNTKHATRTALPVGTHMEVELADTSIGWRGVADVIVLAADGCQIIDFKTGSQAPEHQRQMWVYAMLWHYDSERDPDQVPVKKLTLIYTNGSIDVPVPSATEIATFREGLIESSKELKRKLDAKDVPANPSIENCRYCQVKLLCNDYWKDLSANEPGDRFSNAELVLVEKRGDRGWLARVKSQKDLTAGEQVVLRRFEFGNAFWPDLRPSLWLRVTDTILSLREAKELPVLNLSMLSEALFLGVL